MTKKERDISTFKDEISKYEWQDFFPETLEFKNTVQLVPKQELFCQEYTTNGYNGALAYAKVYGLNGRDLENSTDKKYFSTKASQLLKDSRIQSKIKEIKQQTQEKFNYSRDRSVRKLLVIQKIAMDGSKEDVVDKDGAVVIGADGRVVKRVNSKLLAVAKDCEKIIASIMGFTEEKIENNQTNNLLINIQKQ